MPPQVLDEAPIRQRAVNPQVVAEMRQQLQSIDWQEFDEEVQSKVAPLVEAYAEARVRSRERLQHKVLR